MDVVVEVANKRRRVSFHPLVSVTYIEQKEKARQWAIEQDALSRCHKVVVNKKKK